MGIFESKRAQIITTCVVFTGAIAVLYGLIPYTYSHLPGNELTTGFGALWLMWNRNQDFQHGMLVPILCGIIVYLKRRELATLPIRGSLWGIIILLFGLSTYWIGRRVDNQYLGFFSIQMVVIASVITFLGWRWVWAMAFPLIFLVFAWPMPFLDNLIAFPLRMLMANASVDALNFLGIRTIQQGTAILSAPTPGMDFSSAGQFAVDVADPCSGIRSLYALMMVSSLYGYFTQNSPWKCFAMFAISIPLAVLGNLTRILILTFGTIILGPEIAIGSLEHPTVFHMVAGFFVFIVALGGLIGFGALLSMDSKVIVQKIHLLKDSVTKTEPTTGRVMESGKTGDIY